MEKSSAKTKKSKVRSLRPMRENVVSISPKGIRRAGRRKPGLEQTIMEDTSMEREKDGHMETVAEHDLMVPSAVTDKEEESPIQADKPQDSTPPSPALPPINGFDLSGMSLNQQYSLRSALVLCDCCVHETPEEIFHVIGRNFADTSSLMWFLRRIGKGSIADALRGKDIVDACRKAAHMLARQLKEEIGKPVPRWRSS